MTELQSGSFEPDDDAYGASSPKRARFEGHEQEIITTEEGDEVVVTVPQTQFEIEINSQTDDGGSPAENIQQIQAHGLSGPTFGVIHDTEELGALDPASLQKGGDESDSTTLNAIGRALIQMQQGASSPGGAGSQFIITRATDSDPSQSPNAPLYVMIPPSSSAEILQAMGQPRSIVPKTDDIRMLGNGNEGTRHVREAQRKATHNEVERRRRDRINEMIKHLAQIVPGCQKKDAATGTIVGYVYSKGTVLDKTVEYLQELLQQNEQLSGTAKLAEKSASALSLLQNQITVLEKENAFLRAQIIQFGIDAASSQSQSAAASAAGSRASLLNPPLAQSLLNTVSQASAVVAPSPAPLPPASNPTQAAQNLLLSLAQSLTNSPLLTSLAQSPTSTQLTPSHPHTSTSPSSHLNTPIPHIPQVSAIAQSASSSPLLNSLVQTLSSIAGSGVLSSPPKAPLPPSPSPQLPAGAGGLSAAAAANLLNTLILAQNVLGGSQSEAGATSASLAALGLDTSSSH